MHVYLLKAVGCIILLPSLQFSNFCLCAEVTLTPDLHTTKFPKIFHAVLVMMQEGTDILNSRFVYDRSQWNPMKFQQSNSLSKRLSNNSSCIMVSFFQLLALQSVKVWSMSFALQRRYAAVFAKCCHHIFYALTITRDVYAAWESQNISISRDELMVAVCRTRSCFVSPNLCWSEIAGLHLCRGWCVIVESSWRLWAYAKMLRFLSYREKFWAHRLKMCVWLPLQLFVAFGLSYFLATEKRANLTNRRQLSIEEILHVREWVITGNAKDSDISDITWSWMPTIFAHPYISRSFSAVACTQQLCKLDMPYSSRCCYFIGNIWLNAQ